MSDKDRRVRVELHAQVLVGDIGTCEGRRLDQLRFEFEQHLRSQLGDPGYSEIARVSVRAARDLDNGERLEVKSIRTGRCEYPRDVEE